MINQKLDNAVAKRLGWKVMWMCGYSIGHYIGGLYESYNACLKACEFYARCDLKPLPIWATQKNNFVAWYENWHPSENIADAMSLLYFPDWRIIMKYKSPNWRVIIKIDGIKYEAKAPFLPEALSRAVLKTGETTQNILHETMDNRS